MFLSYSTTLSDTSRYEFTAYISNEELKEYLTGGTTCSKVLCLYTLHILNSHRTQHKCNEQPLYDTTKMLSNKKDFYDNQIGIVKLYYPPASPGTTL